MRSFGYERPALLVRGEVLLPLVVRDGDALPFALEETCFANDTVRPVDHERLFPPELEFGSHCRIVHDLGKLVSGFEFEDVDGTDIPAVRAPGALLELYNDFNHSRTPGPPEAEG